MRIQGIDGQYEIVVFSPVIRQGEWIFLLAIIRHTDFDNEGETNSLNSPNSLFDFLAVLPLFSCFRTFSKEELTHKTHF
jgi:hypothetical protein